MNLFNEIERVTEQYKIDPRIYELFQKLTAQQRYDFIEELIKIEEERIQNE